MAETDITDLYGYSYKVTELQKAEIAACEASSHLQEPVWMEYIQKDKLPSSESKLKDMVRKGVPPVCRTWVWMNTSGAASRKAAVASSYYTLMATAGANSPHKAEIESDVAATFQNHAWVQSNDGRVALARVLCAYSIHNEELGYCRAINNVVGLTLTALNRNEESAFWLLVALIEGILYPGTYSRNLEGCQVEMRALDELLHDKMPRLHAHLRATDTDISLIATDWYLCLFTTSLPAETACRVLDGLFNEGPKVLFRVAVALFTLNEDRLLQCNNAGDIVMAMRQAASAMHNHDKLMATAYEGIGGLPMATIDKFRAAKAKEVESAMRSRQAGSASASPPAVTPESKSNPKLDATADKVKSGLGKFVTGFNKWTDKTATQMAKAMEKVGVQTELDGRSSSQAPHK